MNKNQLYGPLTVPAIIDEHFHALSNAIITMIEPQNRFLVELLFEEAFVNIVLYAYPKQTPTPQKTITISVWETSQSIFLELKDQGIAFDPTSYSVPPYQDHQIGGRGIPMLKQLSRHLSYQREKNQNQLLIEITKQTNP